MTEYEGTLRWFGHAYDTPMYDGMPEVPTPLGENCTMCGEEIAEGDDGVTMPHVLRDGSGDILPLHIECHIRSILGGAGMAKTYREEAKEVFERWGMPNRRITQ